MIKKEISIQDAYHILRQCIGVMLEDRFIEPSIFDIEGDYSNEWLSLQWEEEYRGEILDVVVAFTEGDNQKVLLEGSEMTLVNSDGEEETVVLVREWIPTNFGSEEEE
jgi:hypothetical protein